MEKRTLLFIALAILVWFLWIEFFVKQPRPKPGPTPSEPAVIETEPSQPEPVESVPEPTTPLSPTDFAHPEVPLQEELVIGNEYFKAIFTNQGAGLVSLIMRHYQARFHPLKAGEPKENLKLVDTLKPGQYSLILKETDTVDKLVQTNWKIVSSDSQSITFQYQKPDGLLIRKVFTCLPQSYSLEYKITLENKSDQPLKSQLLIGGMKGISPESDNRTDLIGVRAYQDEKKTRWYVELNEITLQKLESKHKEKPYQLLTQGREDDPNVAWTGIVNQYFATVLIPFQPEHITEYNFGLCAEGKERDPAKPKQTPPARGGSEETLQGRLRRQHNIDFYLKTEEISIQPGEIKTLDFLIFAGPKEKEELAKFAQFGIDKLLSYGLFGFISKILLAILNVCYGLFKNYGIAIILLTVIIKVILFPLTKKGQVSMHKMQQLQPKIKALQAKYKNDKKRQGIEQLKLFREYGVNPLSGCLPLLFQIPVFIGLWRALYVSISMRQAPFMLWITDLSQPDKLCRLPFSILGATDLHILPLLMTASWLIQSLTQPKSPDPQARQSQKLFTFMPLIFLLVLYNMPAGLTLYWLFSTLLGIIEQLIIKRVYFR